MHKSIPHITVLIISLVTFVSCNFNCGTNDKDTQIFNLEEQLIQDGYVPIKMKKMPSGHLHLFGQLNGVDGNFVLDTEAGATVIEKKNKEKFGMQTKATEKKATGAGGTEMQMQTSTQNVFSVGTLKLWNLKLMLLNLDHVNNAFERMGLEKVDGVIGADILTNNKAIIDYTNLILYLKH